MSHYWLENFREYGPSLGLGISFLRAIIKYQEGTHGTISYASNVRHLFTVNGEYMFNVGRVSISVSN